MVSRVGAAFLVAAAFALGTTKIEDPDAWTHLALGREIVHQGALPSSEPLTYPSAGMPFYDTEWLFDVIVYSGHAVGGFAGVIFLKATLAALLLLILWKDAKLVGAREGSDCLTAVLMRCAVLLGALLLIRPRLVERPDLPLMVFLAFTIYALNAYLAHGHRYLYWLPALQVLWANIHPSLVVGMVPFVAVLGGGITLRLVGRWRGREMPGSPSTTQFSTVAVVLAGIVAASLVNPYGPEALTLPFRLATSVWHTHSIVELQRPDPFQHPWPFLVTGLLAVVLIAGARRLPVMAVLLAGPFVVLALSARRFESLLVVVAVPILARGLTAFVGNLDGRLGRHLARGLAVGGAVTAGAATVLALLNAGPFADSRKLPGFGVNDLFLPERALRYLDSAGIEGRLFNTFHWGGYLAWRDFPKRVPIIDGRGYVAPDLLWDIRFARENAGLLEDLRRRYGFDVAVLAYPPRGQAEANAFTPPNWALVYWDDVALVYVRRTPRLAALIERDEYRHVEPTKGVDALLPTLAGGAAAVEAEIRRSLRHTPSSMGHMLLGFVKLQAREYDQAIAEFSRVHGYSVSVDAAQGLAMAHWQKGNVAMAIDQYRRLVAAYPTAMMLYNLGLALANAGQHTEAVLQLERARQRDPQFAPVYPALMHAYHRLGRGDHDEELARGHAAALARGQAEFHLQVARRLTRDGKPDEAVAELEAALRLNPHNPTALSHLGDVYLQQGRLDDALDRQRAALGLDPTLAQAHYGLARVYEERGDQASARTHFERYLRLEPASYLAWTVRSALGRSPTPGHGVMPK